MRLSLAVQFAGGWPRGVVVPNELAAWQSFPFFFPPATDWKRDGESDLGGMMFGPAIEDTRLATILLPRAVSIPSGKSSVATLPPWSPACFTTLYYSSACIFCFQTAFFQTAFFFPPLESANGGSRVPLPQWGFNFLFLVVALAVKARRTLLGG